MTRRIEEDVADFQDIYKGRRRRGLQKYISTGKMFPKRGKNGKVSITIPRIDIPIAIHDDPQEGVSRGEGNPGDVIDKKQGKGKGNQAGDEAGEGIEIQVDLEELWKEMEEELKLPKMKPKPNQTYEDVIIKYNNISIVGPESLRHNRRTLMQAMKRMCSTGDINKLHNIPGFKDPVRLITPINSDKRYRQYREIKIPSNKAVIFFARDGSYSMDDEKCEIVSNISWWIDAWIRRSYDKVERCYIWHDVNAQEVDEKKFYNYRYGGGTVCSSAMKLIGQQFENRYPPNKWNIYVFYFTDGENTPNDNPTFVETIKKMMPESAVNMVGITQVLSSGDDLKTYAKNALSGMDNLRFAEIVRGQDIDSQVKTAFVDLLGAKGASS